jgi:hypothetical protein
MLIRISSSQAGGHSRQRFNVRRRLRVAHRLISVQLQMNAGSA